jgi:outer membrane lipoprotein-sorting protein
MRFSVAGLAIAAILMLGASPPMGAPPTPAMGPAPSATPNGVPPAGAAALALARFQVTWDAVKSYTASVQAHEQLGNKVQDRQYALWFQKPNSTRLDIVGGDGKGSAAVWQGGDRVVGHQGGFLSMIKLNLDIHNKIATSLRGSTIADADFGAQLARLKTVKWKQWDATTEGDKTTITGLVADPDQDNGVNKEVMVLGTNGLPVELTQYMPDGTVAKDLKYTDVQVNVAIPDAIWHI